MKRLLYFFIILIVLLAVAAGAGWVWYQDAVLAHNPGAADSVALSIEAGESVNQLLPDLKNQGLIKDVNAAKIYFYLNKPEVKLQVGNYLLTPGQSLPNLITEINAGPVIVSVNITISEGLRGDEQADIIEQKAKTLPTTDFVKSEYLDIYRNPDKYTFSADTEAFLNKYKPAGKSLEGFLFPDTYNVDLNISALEMVDLQIKTLLKRLDENDVNPDARTRLANFYQVVTLASIIEREVNLPRDMQMVADIFLRRLEQGWTLGADATLLYHFKDWTHVLTRRELDDASNPYNTRALRGLTPTPISNPGVQAISGVVNPIGNNFFFYISDKQGVTRFARTAREHEANIDRYLR